MPPRKQNNTADFGDILSSFDRRETEEAPAPLRRARRPEPELEAEPVDSPRPKNRLRRLLMHTVLQWLGKISYPIYLVHWPLLILLLLGIVRVRPETTSLAAFGILLAIGVPVILLTAWLIHKWIESPLMRFGKRFTR